MKVYFEINSGNRTWRENFVVEDKASTLIEFAASMLADGHPSCTIETNARMDENGDCNVELTKKSSPSAPPSKDARYVVAMVGEVYNVTPHTKEKAQEAAEHLAAKNPSKAVSIWRETATCKSGGIEWSDA